MFLNDNQYFFCIFILGKKQNGTYVPCMGARRVVQEGALAPNPRNSKEGGGKDNLTRKKRRAKILSGVPYSKQRN